MKRKQILARALSLLLFSLAIGIYIARDTVRKHAMGKSAYLTYHANFFYKHLSATPHLFPKIIAYTIFISLFMAVYELLTFALAKLTLAIWTNSDAAPDQPTIPMP